MIAVLPVSEFIFVIWISSVLRSVETLMSFMMVCSTGTRMGWNMKPEQIKSWFQNWFYVLSSGCLTLFLSGCFQWILQYLPVQKDFIGRDLWVQLQNKELSFPFSPIRSWRSTYKQRRLFLRKEMQNTWKTDSAERKLKVVPSCVPLFESGYIWVKLELDWIFCPGENIYRYHVK